MSHFRRASNPFAIVPLLLFGGCGGDEGPDPCAPTGQPTLSANVAPLFAEQCAFSGCHGDRPRAEQSLDGSPAELHAELVEVPSFTAPDMVRIRPGDPDGSFLFRKVLGSFDGIDCEDGDCGSQMPRASDPLSDACVETLRAWIEAGALDD